MRPIVNGLEQQYGERVRFQHLAFYDEDGQSQAVKYGIFAHPGYVVLDAQGNVVLTLVGEVPAETLKAALDQALR